MKVVAQGRGEERGGGGGRDRCVGLGLKVGEVEGNM